MIDEKINRQKELPEDQADQLLAKLLHLKQYEMPDTSRMTRNKQNIMRHVREANSNKRRNLGDLLELNIPWLFAEPRYGIAILFVAFASLQFVGTHTRRSMSPTGIYTSNGNMAMFETNTSAVTNSFDYPEFPGDMNLFPAARNSGDVVPVVRLLNPDD